MRVIGAMRLRIPASLVAVVAFGSCTSSSPEPAVDGCVPTRGGDDVVTALICQPPNGCTVVYLPDGALIQRTCTDDAGCTVTTLPDGAARTEC